MLDQYNGKAGSARRIPIPPGVRPAMTATLGSWLIRAPGQAAAWEHYQLSVVHLRPIPGAPEAVIARPGSTHELLLVALDSSRHPTVDDLESLHHLVPINASVQFASTDNDALRLAEQAVMRVCDGQMPAEPAFPGAGQRLWTEAVDQTLAHYREGKHRA